MHDPYYKQMFKRSCFGETSFENQYYDRNEKYSVHVPVRGQNISQKQIGKNPIANCFQVNVPENQFREIQIERRHYGTKRYDPRPQEVIYTPQYDYDGRYHKHETGGKKQYHKQLQNQFHEENAHGFYIPKGTYMATRNRWNNMPQRFCQARTISSSALSMCQQSPELPGSSPTKDDHCKPPSIYSRTPSLSNKSMSSNKRPPLLGPFSNINDDILYSRSSQRKRRRKGISSRGSKRSRRSKGSKASRGSRRSQYSRKSSYSRASRKSQQKQKQQINNYLEQSPPAYPLKDMIHVQRPKRRKVESRKQRMQTVLKNQNYRKSQQKHGNWYYEKYKVAKGMNPFENSKMRNNLYYDHRTHTIPKVTLKNQVIDQVLEQESDVGRNSQLVNGIYNLKKMGLLKNKDVNQNRLPADNRIKYVYNDYHRRITNPGYSRNKIGNLLH